VFVPSFLSGFTAPGYGGLKFDLTFIPQSAAPLCTGAELVGQSCSSDPGSLLTLMVLGPGSTLLAFDLNGFFEDSAINDSHAAGSTTGQRSVSEYPRFSRPCRVARSLEPTARALLVRSRSRPRC
jgi:hypothetical protein